MRVKSNLYNTRKKFEPFPIPVVLSIKNYDKSSGVGMRKFLLVLGLIIFFNNIMSYSEEKPEPVYSIIKQLRSYDWYKKQAALWYEELRKNDKNSDAWKYFYEANRMARLTNRPDWEKAVKEKKYKYFQSLDTIVESIGEKLPGSFEYYYLKHRTIGDMNKKSMEYLMKAYKLRPDAPELYDEFVIYYEVEGDLKNRKKFNEKWYESRDYSPGILNYNYNVMMSLDDNAIILTNGDNDTYPLWMLQDVKNIKRNVIILNISLMMLEDYRNMMFKKLGFKQFSFDKEELKKHSDYSLNMYRQILEHIIKNRGNRPLFLALTLRNDIYENINDSLYITGLAFKFSPGQFDNLAVMKKNIFGNFLMDYIVMDLYDDVSESVVNMMNMNYMPPLIKLYRHFRLSDNIIKAGEIKRYIDIIAKKNNKSEEVTKSLQDAE